jgi:signal transduction histidine kinase
VTLRAPHDQRIDAAFLTAVVSAVDGAVLVEDAHRRVVAAGAALGELFGGADPDGLVGTRLTDHADAGWARLARETREIPDGDRELDLPDGRIIHMGHRPVTVDGGAAGHVWVFRDVSDVGRAVAELSTLKSRFISVVSHELRTPLTSIATFTEMLTADGDLRPDELPGALAAIQRNTERMLTLLEDLALLGRLESGTAEPVDARALVDLMPLLDAAAGLLQILAPGLTARVYVAPGPAVRGDPRLLRELLLTMAGVTAACAAGGEVYVSARADETEWTISMGVSESHDVTNELLLGTRLPAADPAAPPRSVALAMLLARAIASNQGGTLATSSEAPDTLTLILRLPVPG